ncbi:phage tail protein [Paraliomyxa miuraensis]|uniref:phage tail protein n=1 Tax=Paraliomyxa miuraensis TaxID=376150 RepID=UPI002250B715|nr:phage tail protein [Paraliomyxa miuraensis]MCX4247473.1 phage tail protein [Paraliomyxa miuraensis]
MAQFSVNSHRIDPYKNFRFRVRWDGLIVAGVSKVGALKRSTEIVTHREGGDISTPRLSPSTTKFDPISLERGITFAPEFEAWANMVYSAEGDGGVSLLRFRKDIRIEMLNLQGTVVRAYNVMRCWPSEFTALPELDANGSGIAFESLTLQNEGFERDTSIVEISET